MNIDTIKWLHEKFLEEISLLLKYYTDDTLIGKPILKVIPLFKEYSIYFRVILFYLYFEFLRIMKFLNNI